MSPSPAPARVVLMAPGEARLQPLLGAERSIELRHELLGRARRWAADVAAAPAPTIVLQTPDAPRLRDAVQGLFAAGDGAVLVAWPELAVWQRDHGEAALGDLADGCDVSLGPMFDGGFYLAAFARPVPALLALSDQDWRGSDPLALAAEAARESGVAVGLLRAERGLSRPDDVRALLADPLLDPELRRLLSSL